MVIGIFYLIKYRDKYPIKERSPLLSAVCIIGILVYQESEYILIILHFSKETYDILEFINDAGLFLLLLGIATKSFRISFAYDKN